MIRTNPLWSKMPGEQTEPGPDAGVMKEVAKVLAAEGTIKFDIPHRVRAVYGRQLGIAGANGGYSYSTGIIASIRASGNSFATGRETCLSARARVSPAGAHARLQQV
jgi:hypothetical protein